MEESLTMPDLSLLVHAISGEPVVAEAMAMVMSRDRCEYVSVRDAFGCMEDLREAGLLIYCAPSELTPRSTYTCMRITDAGRDAAAQWDLERMSRSAFLLWARDEEQQAPGPGPDAD